MNLSSSIPVERVPNELCKIHHFRIDHNGPFLPPPPPPNFAQPLFPISSCYHSRPKGNRRQRWCNILWGKKRCIIVFSVRDVNRGIFAFSASFALRPSIAISQSKKKKLGSHKVSLNGVVPHYWCEKFIKRGQLLSGSIWNTEINIGYR